MFQRFTLLVIARVLLLLGNVSVLAGIFGDKRLFFNQIILTIILIVQVWECIRFVNRTNRELSKFLYAIRHADFSITFKQPSLGSSFKSLESGMAEILQAYKQVKIEKEAQFHFLQMLVSHLHVGIIAIEKNDNIILVNPTAQSLVGVPLLKSWKILTRENPAFVRAVDEVGSDGKKLIEIKYKGEARFLSADVRTLIILDKPLRLITLQDINSEIEQKEIEAWHKLIRILTHEIMNSVTPVISLTETMQAMLQDTDGSQKDITALRDHTITDIRFSLNTVQKRSEGLLNFVENYRKLMRVPAPNIEAINIAIFLERIETLLSKQLAEKNIVFRLKTETEMPLHADPVLLEQVLINLITNSIHALEYNPHPAIELESYRSNGHVIIEVTDNGHGIPPKALAEIFVPFFTTRKEGSGIGLSLSKQIMSLHKGSIRVKSEVNVGTTFSLQFPLQR